MLLTGLPVAFSQDNNCVLAQAGIINAEKNNFQTAFINICQNLQLNLDAKEVVVKASNRK